ncbi:MAG: YHYH domain-containing protein [Rubrivivax sp.]|nr:MAG: YHYH domain-containing protein [Rubrivivax sp.]
MKKALAAMAVFLFAASAFAHSGGTDSSGCHNDRKSGGYHCH